MFLFIFCKDEETNSIFSPIYYGDEESNYHYIYSFFYFFFQVQDNPKGLRVFFYQLGPSLHHPHGASFLDAGVVGFGVGGELVRKDLLRAGDMAGITARAREFVAAITTWEAREKA